MNSAPKVTAVMITHNTPERRDLLAAALQAYREQTHAPRELLIVNGGREGVEGLVPGERELRADSSLSLGELRNLGLDHAAGDFICQWDDDDYAHPRRMELQLQPLLANDQAEASLLVYQVRYSFGNDFAFVAMMKRGIPGTILHRRLPGHRYRPLNRKEDSYFIHDNLGSVALADNRELLHLYLRFEHGANTCEASHIMMGHERRTRERVLPEPSRRYLDEILRTRYARRLRSAGVRKSSRRG